VPTAATRSIISPEEVDMELATDQIEVRFRRSRARQTVSLAEVLDRIEGFLEHYCDVPLVDGSFRAAAAGDTGRQRLESLIRRAGFAGNPAGFARALVSRLENASGGEEGCPIEVGSVVLPRLLLLSVLEVLVPGTGFKTVKRVARLEELTNVSVPESERADLQRVLDRYPVRLSWHSIRQMRLSAGVSRQYQPFVQELDEAGEVHTWVGQFYRGIVEQMYVNRSIFIMSMACPVYCRFCFRKHKECRNQRAPTREHVKQAIAYIQTAPDVSEIVLTGGDPFMNRATLQYAVQELSRVPHVRTVRVASRAVSYYPELFLKDDSYWLHYLVRTGLELRQKQKRLELATHMLHPDEISVDALHIVGHLVQHGIPVYVQTPFVRGCNESGEGLVSLFHQLRAVGAELHYLFMPTSPVRGNRVYWAPISQGLRAARYLRAHVSDRAMPHVTTATSIGKIDWNNSGWAVEPRAEDPRYVWIRTPYSREYFEPFAPIFQVGDSVRENAEGTLDAVFHTEIGDPELFAGPRGLTSSPEAHAHKLARTRETVATSLDVLRSRALDDQRDVSQPLGPRPHERMARRHLTRLELDCEVSDAELDAACDVLQTTSAITDVVLSRTDDVLSAFSRTLEVIDRLLAIPSVLVIRLRSLKLIHAPRAFSRPVIASLASRNRLTVVRPTRIEVETQLLHSSELRPEQQQVVRELRARGITVYSNTPLLSYVNDNEEEMLRLAHGCREYGIEFCNVYVCGLPIQRPWNDENPIELSSVIDIASRIRRDGSGREVPRYLLRTPLGEVDFGIRPPVVEPDHAGGVRAALRPHDLSYFRAIDPGFTWPPGVAVDAEGHPRVPLQGVSLENQQFLYASSAG
jgi:L-lysine 2,3-aminomutase